MLACFAGLFALSSWRYSAMKNTGGYEISIGKNDLLHSPKNQPGDTAFVKMKSLNINDSLFVSEWACGSTIKPPDISIHIYGDDYAAIDITLVMTNGRSFIPLTRMLNYPESIRLTIEIYSSWQYDSKGEQKRPLGVLILS